jgi:hypothetical protein
MFLLLGRQALTVDGSHSVAHCQTIQPSSKIRSDLPMRCCLCEHARDELGRSLHVVWPIVLGVAVAQRVSRQLLLQLVGVAEQQHNWRSVDTFQLAKGDELAQVVADARGFVVRQGHDVDNYPHIVKVVKPLSWVGYLMPDVTNAQIQIPARNHGLLDAECPDVEVQNVLIVRYVSQGADP